MKLTKMEAGIKQLFKGRCNTLQKSTLVNLSLMCARSIEFPVICLPQFPGQNNILWTPKFCHHSPNFPHILLFQDKHSFLFSWHLCSLESLVLRFAGYRVLNPCALFPPVCQKRLKVTLERVRTREPWLMLAMHTTSKHNFICPCSPIMCNSYTKHTLLNQS